MMHFFGIEKKKKIPEKVVHIYVKVKISFAFWSVWEIKLYEINKIKQLQ